MAISRLARSNMLRAAQPRCSCYMGTVTYRLGMNDMNMQVLCGYGTALQLLSLAPHPAPGSSSFREYRRIGTPRLDSASSGPASCFRWPPPLTVLLAFPLIFPDACLFLLLPSSASASSSSLLARLALLEPAGGLLGARCGRSRGIPFATASARTLPSMPRVWCTLGLALTAAARRASVRASSSSLAPSSASSSPMSYTRRYGGYAQWCLSKRCAPSVFSAVYAALAASNCYSISNRLRSWR